MIPIGFIFVLMVLLKSSLLAPFALPQQSTSIALGFILIFAFLLGQKTKTLKLPQITGFMLAGILCGPYILNFLSKGDVNDLQLLDGLALSLIALTAGGEMRLEELKRNLKSISSLVISQTGLILGGFLIGGFFLKPYFPFLQGFTSIQTLSFFLLLGTLATATSPSTTIAIINESEAKGKYSDIILSVAVVKDFLVIFLFTFSLSMAKSLTSPSEGMDMSFLVRLLREVGGSVVLGLGVGVGLIVYIRFIKKETTVFILALAFFTYQVSHNFGYHPLMICLIGGFLVENFSSQGDRLIEAIERISLPVYVIFFAISGASINLGVIKTSWLLAIVLVIWRGGLKFVGTFVGAKVAKEEKGMQIESWKGFIAQAGVALGMAVIVEKTFPAWGNEFKAIVLTVIALNQIAGPILFQRLLVKMDEAGKKKFKP